MKNVHTPLAKSVLIPLELKAGASATDTAIQKKRFGSGMTTLIISNEKMNDIIKTVQSLKDSGLMIKCLSKTIKNEAKRTKRRISRSVIRHFSSKFIKKSVNRERHN